MKCENCHKNAATFHYVERENDQIVKDIHLCEECTRLKGIQHMQFSLSTVLGQLMTPHGAVGGMKVEKEMADVTCPKCGLSYLEFRQKTRLGCANDFTVFEKALVPLLEKIHGTAKHLGKIPPQAGEMHNRQRERVELQRELDRLIKAEDYEAAARIRDRIRQVEAETRPEKPA